MRRGGEESDAGVPEFVPLSRLHGQSESHARCSRSSSHVFFFISFAHHLTTGRAADEQQEKKDWSFCSNTQSPGPCVWGLKRLLACFDLPHLFGAAEERASDRGGKKDAERKRSKRSP